MEIFKVECAGMKTVHFAKFSDIQESLRISYSAYEAVDIIKSPSAWGEVVFTVTGVNPHDKVGPFRHDFKVSRAFVFERATHL